VLSVNGVIREGIAVADPSRDYGSPRLWRATRDKESGICEKCYMKCGVLYGHLFTRHPMKAVVVLGETTE